MRGSLGIAWGTALVALCSCGGDAGDGKAGGGSGGTGAVVDAAVGGSGGASGSSSGGSAGTNGDASAGASGDAGADAAKPEPGKLLGSFVLTYYWVTTEAEFSGAKDTNLYDAKCNLIATVPAKFAQSLKLEGTGRLDDGRLLNYDGACSCPTSPCYFEADAQHPWGYGVQGKALVPFRSFAVDPGEIPYGSSVYVPELDGVTVPGDPPWGGFVHDGCMSADDTGGGIVGKHVDWFVALKTSYSTLDGQLALSSVTVHEGGARCP